MEGHIFLCINAEKSGISIPQAGKLEMDKLKPLLKGTPLAHLRAANNTSHNGLVRAEDGALVARQQLFISPHRGEVGKFDIECQYDDVTIILIQVNCWVSDNPRGERQLRCGLHQLEEGVGFEISNDPTKHDPSRMYIKVFAKSLTQAREILLGILEGEHRVPKPWIV